MYVCVRTAVTDLDARADTPLLHVHPSAPLLPSPPGACPKKTGWTGRKKRGTRLAQVPTCAHISDGRPRAGPATPRAQQHRAATRRSSLRNGLSHGTGRECPAARPGMGEDPRNGHYPGKRPRTVAKVGRRRPCAAARTRRHRLRASRFGYLIRMPHPRMGTNHLDGSGPAVGDPSQ
jgi:hypothetical protein